MTSRARKISRPWRSHLGTIDRQVRAVAALGLSSGSTSPCFQPGRSRRRLGVIRVASSPAWTRRRSREPQGRWDLDPDTTGVSRAT